MSKTKLLGGRTRTILTVVAALGVVTTMVLTAKAVPKAEKRKAEAEETRDGSCYSTRLYSYGFSWRFNNRLYIWD